MKYPCNIIRDLLPLYCDDVCSKESAEAVRDHIASCEECKSIFTKMQQGVSLETCMDNLEYEKQQIASMQQIKKKIKKRNTVFGIIGIIFGIGLVVMVIRVMLVAGVIVWAVRDGLNDVETTTNVAEYGDFEGFHGYSKLDVFPRQIDEGMEVQEYYYYFADTFLDPTAQIYLKCSYDKAGYEEETERLSKIQEEYKGKVQSIVYDTESFSYPAYVAIDSDNHCYEYALLLGDYKIAYVFLQFIEEDAVVFPIEYLPERYERRATGYSIYLFQGENGDRYGDFSRNSVTDVDDNIQNELTASENVDEDAHIAERIQALEGFAKAFDAG